MLRCLAGLLLLFSATVSLAQPPKDPPAPTTEVRTLVVAPAGAPTPALKYELLPRLRDRTPGNAALDYHRAHMLRPSWPRDPKDSKKLDDSLTSWEDAPIDKLPVADVKKYLAGYSQTFRTLDLAAKADRCEWELNSRISVRNIDLMLPEAQIFRELARAQKLRIRVELAENNFDTAVRDLQTGFRLGKDVGEGSTLIQSLVGISITAVFLNEIDQLIQRPNSPNMYWALTTLPRPFIDSRTALEGEARLFDNLFPNAKALEKGPVPAEKANAIVADMLTAFATMGDPDNPNGAGAAFGTAAYVTLHGTAARKQLVELGWAAETVEKMPPAQAVALRAITVYRTFTDDQTKCFSLPFPEARTELAKARERADKLTKDTSDHIIKSFALTLPAVEKVHEAHARTARRIAALRAVEAIRLHAALNEGKLPKTLADVKVVSVPDDPYTLKPFEYAVKDDTFTLSGPPPADEKPSRSNNFRYEVALKK
jgi:hypothetical protein